MVMMMTMMMVIMMDEYDEINDDDDDVWQGTRIIVPVMTTRRYTLWIDISISSSRMIPLVYSNGYQLYSK